MEDLPELPFEKILSYLPLEDRIRFREVSRRWCKTIDRFRVRSLCFSERASGFIEGKARLVSGAFAQHFICSPQFESFFCAFAQSILSNLQHLRLCDLNLTKKNQTAFAQIINSFAQLEQLDLIRSSYPRVSFELEIDLELNLPMIKAIQLKKLSGIQKLTLNTPRLQKVKLADCDYDLRLDLVHSESVEWLLTGCLQHVEVPKLQSLKYLYIDDSEIDSSFMSSLKQLKQIHLSDRSDVSNFFEQKQRYGRTDLMIYLWGYLLTSAEDPIIDSVIYSAGYLRYLTENPWRQADEMPLYDSLDYTAIEAIVAGQEMKLLERFTDLDHIRVDEPIQNIERFLVFLKNFDNLVFLHFWCPQPSDLFDRLPENSVQDLYINFALADFAFLFKLQSLICLEVNCPVDAETVRRAFEELEFLAWFRFKHANKSVTIEAGCSKRFKVSVCEKFDKVHDLYAAIQFIENGQ